MIEPGDGEDVAVDSHVHLHGADVASDLQAAASRLRRSCPGASIGVLMLAEMVGVDRFAMIRARSERGGRAQAEPISCWYRDGALPLLIVAGRQIVTAEKLEVLALGTTARLPDGAALPTVLAWTRAQGALAVLPWGVGKWTGRRGQIVRDAVDGADARDMALGDNGGRPALWRVPDFDVARRRGIRILPGSDPLPLPEYPARIGTFGFRIRLRRGLDIGMPARSLLDALRDPGIAIEPFGRHRGIVACIADQVALRISSPAEDLRR